MQVPHVNILGGYITSDLIISAHTAAKEAAHLHRVGERPGIEPAPGSASVRITTCLKIGYIIF